ncbi:MAG: chemotaxis protein CheC [Candidatus Omnitrophota bacterium]
MGWINNLGELRSSALKEIANIGISHAATAIGEITKEDITISLPNLKTFSRQEVMIAEIDGGKVAGGYLTVQGISEYTETLILLSEDNARKLMDKFVSVDTSQLSTEEQKSVFSEVITVIASTYFSAIGGMFNLRINHSIPKVSFNNGAISDFVKTTLKNHEGISIDTTLTSKDTRMHLLFLLIPDPNTLDGFFKAIGI